MPDFAAFKHEIPEERSPSSKKPSAMKFEYGTALLIGIDHLEYQKEIGPFPSIEKEMRLLKELLLDPAICGFQEDHVEILFGENATRRNILKKLVSLKKQLDEAPEMPLIIYFAGPAYRKKEDNLYYFAPYDFDAEIPDDTAIEDLNLFSKIGHLQGQNILLIINGILFKETIDNTTNARIPNEVALRENTLKASGDRDLSAAISDLHPKFAILESFGASGPLLLHNKIPISVFAYHLMEALIGHGKSLGADSMVTVLDLIDYVLEKVPATSAALYPDQFQEINVHYNGDNFAVARLLSGAGLPESGAPALEDLSFPPASPIPKIPAAFKDFIEEEMAEEKEGPPS